MPRLLFPDLLALDRPAVGTWTQIASAECVDMLGAAGFDFAIVDCEHGAFGIETAENLFRACDANGLAPLARAPGRGDARWIGRALDAGAAAVVVPGIGSAADAAEAVAAARYAPGGTRGACPCVRAGGHFIRDWSAFEAAEAAKGVVALVETRDGLDDIEAICATPGLLALLVGPFDLSVSLGFRGDYRAPEVEAAIGRMLAAAASAGLPVMAPVFDPDPLEARRQRDAWASRGVRLFVAGTDKIIFAAAAAACRAGFEG